MTTETPITVMMDKTHYVEGEVALVTGTVIWTNGIYTGILDVEDMYGNEEWHMTSKRPNSDGTISFEIPMDFKDEIGEHTLQLKQGSKRIAEFTFNYTSID